MGLQVPQTKWWHWDGPTGTKSKIVALGWDYKCHKQNGGIGMSLQVPQTNGGIGMRLQVPQTKWWHWDEPTSATNKMVALGSVYRYQK
jgi:hypothetical protein